MLRQQWFIYPRWENREEYARLVEEYKSNEFKRQLDTLRSGIGVVIPPQLLYLLTWQEMELCLCGRPEVDLELLKKNTTYEGISLESTVITNFWKVLESFSNEGSNYLNFT